MKNQNFESTDKIYGRNPVIEALTSNRTVDRIYIQEHLNHSLIGQIRNLAKERGVQYVFVDRRKLDKLSGGGNHQGVVASVAAHAYVSVEEILGKAESKGEPPFVVICEGITDPHNLGSIIRTANAAGAHGVIIPKNRSVALTSTVAKVSAGALEHTYVAKVSNIASTLEKLKKAGLWIVGTDLTALQSHYDCDLKGSLGIVIGSEGSGMSPIVRRSCDFLVKIPMLGEAESLNASVATGVLLYEAVRQRGETKQP